MIKTMLFQQFSTPNIFTELTGKFPQPDTTIEEWKSHCENWIREMDGKIVSTCKSIKIDNTHNNAYYAILSYRYEGPGTALNDYLNPDGSVMRIPEDMSILTLSHIMSDTILWLLDLLEDIKPLTPEQQDLWIEKSGNKSWCYEKGKTWCD